MADGTKRKNASGHRRVLKRECNREAPAGFTESAEGDKKGAHHLEV
jgi:hypothetical protein